MGGFFLGCFRAVRGTSETEDAGVEADGGAMSCLRELNVEMNSMDCGDSPSRLLK